MDKQQQIKVFSDCVFESTDTIEVRELPGRKSFWIAASELPNQFAQLTAENAAGENIYVGVNPRTKVGGSTANDVAKARCLFADFDGVVDTDDVKWKLEGAGLPVPTITVT